jgi:hypothetical protein
VKSDPHEADLVMGDPLRTVVESRTKLEAEEPAARLGFGEAWALPVTVEEANTAQWLLRRLGQENPNRSPKMRI